MKLYLSTSAPWYYCAKWDNTDTANIGAVEEIDCDGHESWPSRILHALADAALAYEDEARLANVLLAKGVRIRVCPSSRADMAIVREARLLVSIAAPGQTLVKKASTARNNSGPILRPE